MVSELCLRATTGAARGRSGCSVGCSSHGLAHPGHDRLCNVCEIRLIMEDKPYKLNHKKRVISQMWRLLFCSGGTFLRVSFPRFHDPLITTLVIPNFVPIMPDTHVFSVESKHNRLATSDVCFGLPSSWLRWHAWGTALPQNLKVRDLFFLRHGRAKKLMSWFSSVHNPSITKNLQTS